MDVSIIILTFDIEKSTFFGLHFEKFYLNDSRDDEKC